jgi:hypothetical protein
MDDKEIEKKMEALGKEVGKKKSEQDTEAEKGECELKERRAAFERINAQIIEPSLEFLKSLASKGGIAISVEKCSGDSNAGVTAGVGSGSRLTIMPLPGYSGITCITHVAGVPGGGYHPDTTETWTLDGITSEVVKTAILTFMEDAMRPAR